MLVMDMWIPLQDDKDEMVLDSVKYNISEERRNHYETVMFLTVRRWRKRDEGHYKCISKNSLGTADGRIQTYSECVRTLDGQNSAIFSSPHLTRSLTEMSIPPLQPPIRGIHPFAHHSIFSSLAFPTCLVLASFVRRSPFSFRLERRGRRPRSNTRSFATVEGGQRRG